MDSYASNSLTNSDDLAQLSSNFDATTEYFIEKITKIFNNLFSGIASII